MRLLREDARLVEIWLIAVAILGLLLAISHATREGADDPDPARQRPGILDLGDLPAPAPELTRGIPARGAPSVVFFGGRKADELCRALTGRTWRPASTKVYLVVDRPPGSCGDGVEVVEGSVSRAASAFGLARPRDGKAPLGYAIVDARGMIRYRTLDPGTPTLLAEVDTMLAAL